MNPYQGISSKVNIIAQLEFELAYYDIEIQHVIHYATGNPYLTLVILFIKYS